MLPLKPPLLFLGTWSTQQHLNSADDTASLLAGDGAGGRGEDDDDPDDEDFLVDAADMEALAIDERDLLEEELLAELVAGVGGGGGHLASLLPGDAGDDAMAGGGGNAAAAAATAAAGDAPQQAQDPGLLLGGGAAGGGRIPSLFDFDFDLDRPLTRAAARKKGVSLPAPPLDELLLGLEPPMSPNLATESMMGGWTGLTQSTLPPALMGGTGLPAGAVQLVAPPTAAAAAAGEAGEEGGGGTGRYVPPALRAQQQQQGEGGSAVERRITGLLNR